MIISARELEAILQRLPDDALLYLAGSMSRTLRLSDEVDPMVYKLVLADRLEVLSVSAGDSSSSSDPRG